MSQPNLNEDLNIVSNSNIEITLLDGDLNIIQALDDEPNDVGGLTSAELKAKFDEGPNKIKTYINETLIPEILTEEATEADRAAAEAVREANEAQRIENENARIAAEQARVDETNGVVAQANQAAQSWAVGGTGTREGEDTNNAKYWSEQAAAAAGGGVTSFKGRTGSVIPASGDYTAEMVGAYSKEETDTLLQNKADKDRVVNPNLLDNWYFGNPVDQRGGYVVPPGTTYYKAIPPDFPVAGTATKYIQVRVVDTHGSAIFSDPNGGEFDCFVPVTNCVRGYTGTGYGIDRWWFSGTSSTPATVIIESDCVKLLATDSFRQLVENPSRFAGKKLTLSMLIEGVTTGTGHTGIIVDNAWIASISLPTTTQKTLISVTADIPNNLNMLGAWYYGASGTEYKIYAVKLELGDQQTLAHQDENGNWVLNEIPSKAEQLAVCSNYDPETGVFKNTTFAPAYSYGTTDLTAGTSPLETGKLYFVYE